MEKMYVMNNNKEVFRVDFCFDNIKLINLIELNLTKIMTYDYVEGNIQGFIKTEENNKNYDRLILVDIITESIQRVLEWEGYEIIDDKPQVYAEMTVKEKENYKEIYSILG